MRYIDADKFKNNLEKAMEKMHLIGGVKGVDVGAVIVALDRQPTADVVPRAELDAMRGAANSYKMHYENAKAEVAREIFEEIEKSLNDCTVVRSFDYGKPYFAISKFKSNFAELKKKYTEGG